MNSAVIIPAELRSFVDAQRVARLATVDEAGRPHVVPICFCLIEDVLYSAIDEKPKTGSPARLRRLRNIAANPHVQVLFDVYDDVDWSALRYVQLRGTASLVEQHDERAKAIATLRAKYVHYEHMSLEDRPLIRVAINRIVAWDASSRR